MNDHNNVKRLQKRRKERAVLMALVILLERTTGESPRERYDAGAVLADLESAIKHLSGGPTEAD